MVHISEKKQQLHIQQLNKNMTNKIYLLCNDEQDFYCMNQRILKGENYVEHRNDPSVRKYSILDAMGANEMNA